MKKQKEIINIYLTDCMGRNPQAFPAERVSKSFVVLRNPRWKNTWSFKHIITGRSLFDGKKRITLKGIKSVMEQPGWEAFDAGLEHWNGEGDLPVTEDFKIILKAYNRAIPMGHLPDLNPKEETNETTVF